MLVIKLDEVSMYLYNSANYLQSLIPICILLLVEKISVDTLDMLPSEVVAQTFLGVTDVLRYTFMSTTH